MISYLDVLTILLIFFLTAAAKGLKKPTTELQPTDALIQTHAAPQVPRQAALPQQELSDPSAAHGVPQNQSGFVPKLGPFAVPTAAGPEFTGLEKKLREEGLDVHNSAEPAELNDNSDDPTERGLRIRLPQAVLFSPGDDRIHSAAFVPLAKIAAALRGIPNKVNLAGHADATPIHNRRFRNNWELAAARSLRLMEALTRRYGIEESRLSISSYGSLEPKSPNDTRGGRANNRRVEILILSERSR